MLTSQEIKSVIGALEKNAKATERLAKAQEEANSLALDINRAQLSAYTHFVPYGASKSSCGINHRLVKGTDTRAQTTCPACRSNFTDDNADVSPME